MATTVSVSDTSAQANETTPGEQMLVLHGIGWDQYETVLKAFPEQGGLHITYLDGRLTFVSPTRRHDWYEDSLGMVVKAVASGLGIEWEPSGHATYRRGDLDAGVEGDQTFYFGDNAATMRGPVNVDLASQPPPDIAIEVEVTHRSDDSVEVWRRLRVPEVWRLDVRRGTLVFMALQSDGCYMPIESSRALPALEPGDVLAQLQLAQQIGSSRWVAQLAEWVRDTILPRRGGQLPRKAET
jgi:Uma2 family endonuclease